MAIGLGFFSVLLGTTEEFTLPSLSVFYTMLIVILAGIIMYKINKLSNKLDALLEDKCSCQKQKDDDNTQSETHHIQ